MFTAFLEWQKAKALALELFLFATKRNDVTLVVNAAIYAEEAYNEAKGKANAVHLKELADIAVDFAIIAKNEAEAKERLIAKAYQSRLKYADKVFDNKLADLGIQRERREE